MPSWLSKNFAAIAFFTLVILAIVGINVSNQGTLSKAETLLNQAEQMKADIDKYDQFLLYRYGTKTEDYATFAQDVTNLTNNLKEFKKNITPTPVDDECNQLRSDMNTILDFKIENYEQISFDLEPYTTIYNDMTNLGQLKKVVLNTDKISKEARLEQFAKIDESAKKVNEFYKTKRAGEPKLLEKVESDTGLISKAYESLKTTGEIEKTIYDEVVKNFGPNQNGVEQWPAEKINDYILDYEILGVNDIQSAYKDFNESIRLVATKYRPEKLQN